MMQCVPIALRFAVTLLACLGFSGGVEADDAPYPSRPIHIVVPFPPGGSSDTLARIYGKELGASLEQPVIVDNRPGGNTVIGTQLAAKSKPDGYTILFVDSSFLLTPLLYPGSYDPIKDFMPIASTNKMLWVLAINPAVQAGNLRDLMELATAKPGTLNYSTAGSVGVQRLMGEQLAAGARIDIRNVPYKGSSEMMTDLLSNRVQMAFLTPVSVTQYVKSGQLKALAITGASRSTALPQTPTFTEAGLSDGPSPGLGYIEGYWAFVAPRGTPKAIIDRLARAIGAIITQPEISKQLTEQGMPPFESAPDQLAVRMESDLARYASVLKRIDLGAER